VTDATIPKKKNFQLVLHPAAFAILPVTKVWETCIGNYMLVQYLETFAVLIGISLVLFFILRLCLKDSNKGGLAASLFFGAFYLWLPFRGAISNIEGLRNVDDVFIAAVYLLLWLQFSLGLLLKFADKLPLGKVTNFLNVLSWAVVLSALIPNVMKETELEQSANQALQKVRDEYKDVKLSTKNGTPDIYYIVVDAFPNPHTLKDYFQYDSELVQHLRRKGFFVADRAVSNHDRTELSVTSTLNMRYSLDVKSVPILFQLLQKNEVATLLKGIGYKYVNASSAWEPTNFIPAADQNVANWVSNNFNVTLMRLTLLSAFEKQFHFMGNTYRDARLRVFNDRQGIKSIPGPKFVLVHTLICHPPFFLDEQGKVTNLSPEMMNEDYPPRDQYLAQLKFGERRLIEFIDTLLSDTAKYNPIVIIQSDHGSVTRKIAFEPSYINERMRILSAFHLCPPVTAAPPDSISSVNSFRWIFDNYFGANLPMLPDDSYAAVPFEDGFNPKKVNDYIKFPERETEKQLDPSAESHAD
jgi:hypothetical protein